MSIQATKFNIAAGDKLIANEDIKAEDGSLVLAAGTIRTVFPREAGCGLWIFVGTERTYLEDTFLDDAGNYPHFSKVVNNTRK